MTGAVNVVAVNGATFYVTGVKLEIGSVATPFNRQSPARSMADCQRYYSVAFASARFTAAAAGATLDNEVYFPAMRATPTAVQLAGGAGTNVSTINFLPDSINSARFEIIATAAGDFRLLNSSWSLTAEL